MIFTRKTTIAAAISLAVYFAMPHLGATQASAATPDIGGPDALWRDANQSPDARAKDLLPRLTLEEKISLVHADTTFTSPGLPRFNIPKLWMSDGPQGVREEVNPKGWGSAHHDDDFATAMPASIGLAASFDPDLAAAYGGVIGEEARTRGKHIMLCPGLNIMRTPLNGRNSEYFGEDPYLSGRMAVGFITALQSKGVAACAKHYALNNQETRRGSVNVTVDERTMREIYLPAFKAAVTEGHVWTVMSAYNRVNGVYCSANRFLLHDVLKGDWQFPGIVITDWGGAHTTVDAANNGLDLEMGTDVDKSTHDDDYLGRPLLKAVQDGKVSAAAIDEMALRNLRVMAFVGNLNPTKKTDGLVPLMSPEHIEATRHVAEGGMVLLKNDRNVLPIDPAKIKTIAVIGANAKAKFAHDGNSATIKTRYEITPLEGITYRAGDAIKVTFTQGYNTTHPHEGKVGLGGAVTSTQPDDSGGSPELTAAAVDAAKSADMVVVVAGLYRSQDQEGRDRPNMDLPPGQADLIAAVTKANPKTVVILTGGSPSVVSPWIGDAAGLLMEWYGGTEGGNALARLLFGDVSPSGKLPCTWPKQLSDSPVHIAHNNDQFPGTPGEKIRDEDLTPQTGPQETYSEGIFVGYRGFDQNKIEPQFPFGFGLTYTSFKIADLKLAESSEKLSATVAVTNTGTREAADVIQLYVSEDHPTVPRPVKELKAFKKIAIQPGETTTVSLDLDPKTFAYYDVAQHAWIANAGDYTIQVGDSSRDLPTKATFHLSQPLTIKEGA